jgi:hypothetical protein
MISMIHEANNGQGTLTDFEKEYKKQIGRRIMEAGDNDAKLRQLYSNYRKILGSLVKEPFQQKMILAHLDEEASVYNIWFADFRNLTLIESLLKLSMLQRNIELAEYAYLNLK